LPASSLTKPGEGKPSTSPTGEARSEEEEEEEDDDEQAGGDLEGESGREEADMTNLGPNEEGRLRSVG